MKRLAVSALALTALSAQIGQAAADTATDEAARWVGLIDHGQYDQSWLSAGAILKSRISQAEWAGKIAPVRAPFGAVVSRTFASETKTDTLPGAPDGHYDVIRFGTVFSGKKVAVETVVLAREGDSWKVDGYFVK